MVAMDSFLGFPLRTQRQRRLLVVLYYLLVAALAALMLWRPHAAMPGLFSQAFLLGGLLGGVKMGGPVKTYSEKGYAQDLSTASEPLSLDLSGFIARRRAPLLLDERERGERDRAHFRAYRILLASLAGLALVCVAGLHWAPDLLLTRGPAMLWLLMIYALSLPQSVILWTESVVTEELRPIPV